MTTVSPFHPAHGATTLASIVDGLARSPECWRALVEHEAGARRYAPIPLDGVDAWVISWAPGTGLALHDHGGADGALTVVEGSLLERHGSRQVPSVLQARALDLGTTVVFDADHVHEVTNVGEVAAVSIQVYAPALDRMTFFADDPRDDVVVPAASTRGRS